MEQPPFDKLVKARVVADTFSMSLSQVYLLAAAGSIKSYLVGRRKGGVRFDLREVREDLRRQPAASELVGK